MILKALYDYYNRCEGLSHKGLEYKEIGYLIVIASDGTFVSLESRMQNKKTAASFVVSQAVKRTGQKFVANYLWDNYEYVIGGKDSNVAKKHNAFISVVETVKANLPQNKNICAVSNFYKKYQDIEEVIATDPLYEELRSSIKNISFLINGERKIVAEDSEILDLILSQKSDDEQNGVCLILGERKIISRLHTTIKLSKDTGPLISFQKNRGYDSYGKKQGYNATISEDAEFAYTTALNAMLQSGSRNKFAVGNRTFVFWASSKSEAAEQAEDSLFDLLGYTEEKQDDPNAKIEQVRKVFTSIYSGTLKTSLDDNFYILGLAPNSARIAVVYWSESSLKDFASKILRHFEDMEIIDTRKEKKPYMGIKDMLSAVTLGGKQSEATPNLPEAIVKSIFQGMPYPYTLFSACIRRIRAESGDKEKSPIRIGRIAILKAYLNRTNDNNKKINTMLDKDNTNPGYLCGRLFAVLDRTQEDANGISSIRERYMNAASATPSSVFATILNLSSHHLEKLPNEGKKVFYEKLKQEIIDKIPAEGFPAHLDLQDQGRFFIGYYHQRQDFFTKKEEDKD